MANRKAEDDGVEDLYLVRGDMRYLPFKNDVFNYVISTCTSFGYFFDKENELIMREVVRVLKRGGTFILDMANHHGLLKIFVNVTFLI
jgi:ubiquinone/menaquinone biosynthesis C-methylase UbiE